MKGRKIAVHWLIFIGMVVGILLGILAVEFAVEKLLKDWITPIGDIFVRLLELIAIPLLFVSLIKSVINLQNKTKLFAIGWRTMALYLISTTVAVILGIVLVMTIKPGNLISAEASIAHFGDLSSQVDSTLENASLYAQQSPLQPIVDMIPTNVVDALSSSTSMLQALVLAVLLGVAIVTIKGSAVDTFRKLIDDLDIILSRCIDMVMYIAPVGIMALMANVVVDSNGDVVLLGALGLYSATVLAGMFIIALVIYPIAIGLFTKIKAKEFLKSVLPIQLVAISTSSSAATLPTTMKVSNDVLKIPKNVTSFTLPMGVTINMDGSSIFIAITVIFLAQVMNIELSAAQIFTVVTSAIIASIGTPGIPGGVLITLVMVLNSMGIPAEGLALIIALVRPLDMFVTAVNVTGDVAVSAVVADNMESEI